jgi:hypothetical protein
MRFSGTLEKLLTAGVLSASGIAGITSTGFGTLGVEVVRVIELNLLTMRKSEY